MSKVRRDAARTIAHHLFAAERDVDQAFGSAASLAAVLPAMRAEAGVSAIVARHDVFRCVARALDLQAQARSALVEAHAHCADAAESFRIPTTGYGDGGDKTGPGGSLREEPQPLRAVG